MSRVWRDDRGDHDGFDWTSAIILGIVLAGALIVLWVNS